MEQKYSKVRSVYWKIIIFAGIFVVLVWIAVFSRQPDGRLHVNFYDVGQGDAAFIKTSQGSRVLIDGGPDTTVLEKLGGDLPFYQKTLDIVILSHPHSDHLAGLVEVFKRYEVKNLLLAGITHDAAAYQALLDAAKQKNVNIIQARAGQRVWLDKYTVLDLFYPPAAIQGQLFDDLNESSIITRLSFGQNGFLFTGDAPMEQEREAVDFGQNINSTVLKVAHHGSKKSTGEIFLQAVAPEYAVISVGAKNSYGHPAEETLNRLEKAGIRALRTDKDGDIRIQSDGIGVCLEIN